MITREREPEASPPSAAPWLAAAAFAVWPTQVYAATLTQGLSIAVLLTLAALACAFRWTPIALITAGVLAGFAALTEPLLALPLLLTSIVLGRRHGRPNTVLLVGTALMLVAPWLYRNAIVFGRPIPITSNAWRDAFVANSAGSGLLIGSRFRSTAIARLSPADFDRLKKSEPQRCDVFRAWALRDIAARPLRATARAAARVARTLGGAGFRVQSGRGRETAFAALRLIAFVASVPVLDRAFRGGVRPLFVALVVGLLIVPAFGVASDRIGVLMDVPQGLAATIAVDRWRRHTAA